MDATATSLLGFLHEGPMTGWDLVSVAQQRIGSLWTLTQSQVYRESAAMAKAGLVEAGEPGRRERKPYAITAGGREAFRSWLDQEPDREHIRFPLLMTIAFARHLPPGRLAAILAAHRGIHADRLAGYRQIRDDVRRQPAADGFRLATLEFGIRYEQAVLEWFDELPALLPDAKPRDLESPAGKYPAGLSRSSNGH